LSTDQQTADLINCLVFTPNNKYLLTGGDDGKVKIYNNYNLQLIKTINASDKEIVDLLPSKTSDLVAGFDTSFTLSLFSLSKMNMGLRLYN